MIRLIERTPPKNNATTSSRGVVLYLENSIFNCPDGKPYIVPNLYLVKNLKPVNFDRFFAKAELIAYFLARHLLTNKPDNLLFPFG